MKAKRNHPGTRKGSEILVRAAPTQSAVAVCFINENPRLRRRANFFQRQMQALQVLQPQFMPASNPQDAFYAFRPEPRNTKEQMARRAYSDQPGTTAGGAMPTPVSDPSSDQDLAPLPSSAHARQSRKTAPANPSDIYPSLRLGPLEQTGGRCCLRARVFFR